MIALVCPSCKSDQLATTENISGSAYGSAFADEKGERFFTHEGWTEVWWDSSTSVGVECRDCFWRSGTENWLAELIPQPDDDEGLDE